MDCHTFLLVGTRAVARSQISAGKPLSGQKYPCARVLKILSMEELEGRVQLKMENCLFRR